MKYQREITEIIKVAINITEPIEDINTNLQNIGVNSIAFVGIIVEIEDKFDIEFPDEKLVINQTGTIKDLCEIIIDIKGDNDEI